MFKNRMAKKYIKERRAKITALMNTIFKGQQRHQYAPFRRKSDLPHNICWQLLQQNEEEKEELWQENYEQKQTWKCRRIYTNTHINVMPFIGCNNNKNDNNNKNINYGGNKNSSNFNINRNGSRNLINNHVEQQKQLLALKQRFMAEEEEESEEEEEEKNIRARKEYSCFLHSTEEKSLKNSKFMLKIYNKHRNNNNKKQLNKRNYQNSNNNNKHNNKNKTNTKVFSYKIYNYNNNYKLKHILKQTHKNVPKWSRAPKMVTKNNNNNNNSNNKNGSDINECATANKLSLNRMVNDYYQNDSIPLKLSKTTTKTIISASAQTQNSNMTKNRVWGSKNTMNINNKTMIQFHPTKRQQQPLQQQQQKATINMKKIKEAKLQETQEIEHFIQEKPQNKAHLRPQQQKLQQQHANDQMLQPKVFGKLKQTTVQTCKIIAKKTLSYYYAKINNNNNKNQNKSNNGNMIINWNGFRLILLTLLVIYSCPESEALRLANGGNAKSIVANKEQLNIGLIAPHTNFGKREYLRAINTAVGGLTKTRGAKLTFLENYSFQPRNIHFDMMSLTPSPTGE